MVEVNILKQKVYHDGRSMIVLKPGKGEVEERFVPGLIAEGVVEHLNTSFNPSEHGGDLDHHAGKSTAGDELSGLRDQYERVVGKRWFHGWSADELRQRIGAHNSASQAAANASVAVTDANSATPAGDGDEGDGEEDAPVV